MEDKLAVRGTLDPFLRLATPAVPGGAAAAAKNAAHRIRSATGRPFLAHLDESAAAPARSRQRSLLEWTNTRSFARRRAGFRMPKLPTLLSAPRRYLVGSARNNRSLTS